MYSNEHSRGAEDGVDNKAKNINLMVIRWSSINKQTSN